VIAKKLACWRLATYFGLPRWDVFLPTGCDCILESVLEIRHIGNNKGELIRVVDRNMGYILCCAIPVFGIYFFIMRILWRYGLLYHCVMPALHPKMSDWVRLFWAVIPSFYYLKVWRDYRNVGSIRKNKEDN